jgi:hypothetical protein
MRPELGLAHTCAEMVLDSPYCLCICNDRERIAILMYRQGVFEEKKDYLESWWRNAPVLLQMRRRQGAYRNTELCRE